MTIKTIMAALVSILITMTTCAQTQQNKKSNSENMDNGKRIISFATSGGRPIEPCIEALQKQYPNLGWDGGKLLNHATKENLENWKQQLGL